MKEKDYFTWKHMSTDKNSADVGSRGCDGAQLWLKGLEWLEDPESWPAENLTEPSKETEVEGLYGCCERIQGSDPVYLIQDAHVLKLHGGEGLT